MRFVPCVAGHIALAAAQDDGKFAVSNVVYEELDNNRFKAVATDCKILAVLEGKCPDADLHPAHDKLAAAPNGCARTMIPADVFARVMKPLKIGKSNPKRRSLETTGISSSTKEKADPTETTVNVVTFVASDGKGERVEQIEAEQPRFPPYSEIFPSGRPQYRIAINIASLQKLLTIASKLSEVLTIDFYKPTQPFILKCENPDDELTFVGLSMPCSLDNPLPKVEDVDPVAVEPAN